MINKWLNIIFDHKIILRERMFRITTAICMVALIFTLPMGRSVLNLVILVVSLAVIAAIVRVSIRRGQVQNGATAIVVLLLALFPFTFFTAGGFYSGVPEWFVLCFIYVCITLQGKRMAVFFMLCAAETLLCYSIAYYFPELASLNNQQRSFFESAFSMVMVGLLTSVLLMFLNRMYEEENALTQQQKKEIEELNQAENHFFSSMSHEIRTPINTIIGLNEITLRGDIPEEVAENARNIQGASKLLLTLINDILDISKIKSGKMEFIYTTLRLSEIFAPQQQAFALRVAPGVKVIFESDGNDYCIVSEKTRLTQVLTNFLSNAVKFTSSGSIRFGYRLTDDGIYVYVTDTGMGISKESQASIFNRFVKLNSFKQGTGLGLSICKTIIEKLKGKIGVESEEGKGSTFWFTIPCQPMKVK